MGTWSTHLATEFLRMYGRVDVGRLASEAGGGNLGTGAGRTPVPDSGERFRAWDSDQLSGMMTVLERTCPKRRLTAEVTNHSSSRGSRRLASRRLILAVTMDCEYQMEHH